jgi:shikimate dehydrogenase
MWPSASTRPVVLVGDPVAHSLSPAIHNAAFRALNLDLVYVACRVQPEGLVDALRGLLAMGAAGVNVTLPHKQAAAFLASRLTSDAASTGAANTLVPEAGGWLGCNTDIEGFLAPLADAGSFDGREVVILGAGGAARAAAYALLTSLAPARVTIAARDPVRAAHLVSDLRGAAGRADISAIELAAASLAVRRASLLVNATSVGMSPGESESPWPDADDIGPTHVVYDLIYTPAPSRLLRESASRGARTIDGREMLLQQAAASFLLWTGQEMPMDVAREALSTALTVGKRG